MTTDNWQQFKEIFQAALELPREERPAYLDRVCTQRSSRAELEALLLCYEHPPDGIDEPIAAKETETSNGAEPAQNDPLVESFMDHYQIIEKVGDTGPAAKYLAVRLNGAGLTQVVIMIVKTTTSATEFLLSFKKERLALMNLRHPNIASFLDTGITRDGLPYLAMEYIEGLPASEYCDSNKLNTHSRIKLFMHVCGAVQYAHQRFIAHGGINSKSVLATKDGTAKLLGLGIVDLLNQELRAQGGLTAALKQRDLEYVSLEQIRGEPATAVDDVYSLGVLLYQLLTGHSPYRINDGKQDELVPPIFEAIKPSKVLGQVVEQADRDGKKTTITPDVLTRCRNEPIASVRRLLAGDLDSILLKAISRDSSKRYTSVEQFSGDLRCYLEGRPVSSRENTFLYRASKFVRRYKFATIAAACLTTAVIVALTIMVEGLLRR
jgi:serine/threonine protein kinase